MVEISDKEIARRLLAQMSNKRWLHSLIKLFRASDNRVGYDMSDAKDDGSNRGLESKIISLGGTPKLGVTVEGLRTWLEGHGINEGGYLREGNTVSFSILDVRKLQAVAGQAEERLRA